MSRKERCHRRVGSEGPILITRGMWDTGCECVLDRMMMMKKNNDRIHHLITSVCHYYSICRNHAKGMFSIILPYGLVSADSLFSPFVIGWCRRVTTTFSFFKHFWSNTVYTKWHYSLSSVRTLYYDARRMTCVCVCSSIWKHVIWAKTGVTKNKLTNNNMSVSTMNIPFRIGADVAS
jgi:hypothetical protein